jgi:hypothetical protein
MTSVVGSAGSRTVDITGEKTGEASDSGDAEGAGGRTNAVQIEREREGVGR